MESLWDESLLEAYRIAMKLNLEEAFIQMLLKEMGRRGLTAETSEDEIEG